VRGDSNYGTMQASRLFSSPRVSTEQCHFSNATDCYKIAMYSWSVILAPPHTSVSGERLFSMAGDMYYHFYVAGLQLLTVIFNTCTCDKLLETCRI